MIEILLAFVMLFLLFCAAAEDAIEHKVSDGITVPFALIGVCVAVLYSRYISMTIAVMLIIITLTRVKSIENMIGGADLLIYSGVISFYGIRNITVLLLIPSLISLAIIAAEKYILKRSILTGSKGIAFIPSMLLSVPFWTVLI